MKKTYMYLVACTFLFTLGLSFVTGSSVAHASGLSGWAWSSTIGWVSLDSTNPELSGVTPAGSPYGVNISMTNLNSINTPAGGVIGTLSGYAWSPNIGWISFDPADITSTNCPTGSACTPTVNLTTGAISGWARALAGSGTMGWDGWIELAGTNHVTNGAAASRGVTFSSTTNTFSGYAWGSTNVGWLSFANATCPGCYVPLTVVNPSAGAITITSSPAGISCSSGSCTGNFLINTKVNLTATQSPNYTLQSWGSSADPCYSAGTNSCNIVVLQPDTVTPSLQANLQLTISKSGTGTGSLVTQLVSGPASSPVITCGVACTTPQSALYTPGTSLLVVPTAAPGSSFRTFTATLGCSGGQAGCPVNMSVAQTVTAQFDLNGLLTVAKSGTGTGTVTSADGYISCGASCTYRYPWNSPSVLTAIAATGSYFTGWTGACSGYSTTCTVYGGPDQTATALFSLNPTVSVTTTGTGGIVTGNGVISCTSAGGAGCVGSFNPGTVVNLTAATTSAGSSFGGWGGACSSSVTNTCQITMQASNVGDTATTYSQWKSQVFSAAALAASSTVGDEMSNPMNDGVPNIYKYAVGMDPYTAYTSANHMAVYRAYTTGANFTWDHKTNVKRTDVTFKIAASNSLGGAWSYFPATASLFTETSQTIDSFTKLVTDVSSTPYYGNGAAYFAFGVTKGGIDYWAPAAMSPAPTINSTNPGLPASTLPLTVQPVIVTAAFTANPTLTIAGSGTGSGSVTGSGIACAHTGAGDTGTCSAQYSTGTNVTLTAAPTAGSAFVGWSGASCVGLTCTVTVDASKTVTAAFTLAPVTLTVTTTGSGGIVTSGDSTISCGSTCSASYTVGTVVNLTAATTTAGYMFTGWGGACTGTTPTCAVTMSAAKSVSATFDVVVSNLSGTCVISPASYTSAPVTVNPTLTKSDPSASWLQTSITFNSFGTFSPTVTLSRSPSDQVVVQCNQVSLTSSYYPPSNPVTGTCTFPSSPYTLPSGFTTMTETPTLNASGGTGPYTWSPSSFSYGAGVYQPTILVTDSINQQKWIQCDSFTVNSTVAPPAGTYKLYVGDTAAQASALNNTSVIENSATPFYLYWLNSTAGCTWAITRNRPVSAVVPIVEPASYYTSQWTTNGLPSTIVQNQIGLKKINTTGIPVDTWHFQMMCGGVPKGNMVNMNVGDSTVIEI